MASAAPRVANDLGVRAVSKYAGLSAQKVRLVLDQVRGKGADEAIVMLEFMPQAAALYVRKTIASAAANAVETYGWNREDLYIAKAYADEGPTRRWRRFGARGRF